MLPLLPFAVGLLTGAITVRLLRNPRARDGLEKVQEKARLGLGKTQDKLRSATISGLSAVESASAAMKQRLSADKTAMAETTTEADLPAERAAPATLRKVPRKKSATTVGGTRAARKPATPKAEP